MEIRNCHFLFIFQGEIKQEMNNLIEKEARDVVTKYYDDLDGVAVVIIHGIDMQILDAEKGKDIQELDFLIINYSKQYILNIEVKRSLTHVQIRGRGKSVIEKSKEQVIKIKKIIEAYYPHLKGKWKFCSMLYCVNRDDSVMECTHCADFIAQGPQELFAKIKLMDEMMPVILSSFSKNQNFFLELALHCNLIFFAYAATRIVKKGS